jgi:uncharacterized cupredoxin-like copper-binding protein
MSIRIEAGRARAGALAIAVALGVLAGAGGAGAAPASGTTASAARVNVVLTEWKLIPSVVRVSPGAITFVVRNTGKIVHELVVVRSGRHHHLLPMAGSQATETGLVGEIEEFKPGETRRLTVKLAPGKYVLLCNLPGHYRAGQYAALRVG